VAGTRVNLTSCSSRTTVCVLHRGDLSSINRPWQFQNGKLKSDPTGTTDIADLKFTEHRKTKPLSSGRDDKPV
jgi:hypothetical protein